MTPDQLEARLTPTTSLTKPEQAAVDNSAHHAWCQQFRPTCCDRGPIGGVCDDGCACLPCRASFAAAQKQVHAQLAAVISERDGHRGYAETVRNLRTENDGLREELSTIGVLLTAARASYKIAEYENGKMSKLLVKASCKFQAVGDSFTAWNSPTNGDYYRALARECEQAAALKPEGGGE